METPCYRTKTRKPLAIIIAIVALIALFTACGKKAPDITQQDIVDDYSKIAFQKESINQYIEQSIETAETWTAQSSNAEETAAALAEIYNKAAEEYNSLDNYELSDEMKQALEKYEIDSADYVAMADERIDDLYFAAQSVSLMYDCVMNGDDEGLWKYIDNLQCIYDLEAHYSSLELNYLFCNWSGDALDYVQENIVDKLAKEYQPSEWLTDRDEIEQSATECLNQLEELMTKQQLQIEKDKLALEQMTAELTKE